MKGIAKILWCVECVSCGVLYVRYFLTEREALREAGRVFQLYSMPSVFRVEAKGWA